MNNKEIAKVFHDLACFLELKKDNIFKIRAYQKVARTIEQLPEELSDVMQKGQLQEIPGVGDAIEKKIIEILTTGKLGLLEKLKSEFPPETK
jgi:DNA polymerase (family X)